MEIVERTAAPYAKSKVHPKTQVPKTGTWGTLPVRMICEEGKDCSFGRQELARVGGTYPGHPSYSLNLVATRPIDKEIEMPIRPIPTTRLAHLQNRMEGK
jgi:hypothetical protein